MQTINISSSAVNTQIEQSIIQFHLHFIVLKSFMIYYYDYYELACALIITIKQFIDRSRFR